ncbi:MAG: glycosyltransferase [Rhodospirillaceae bacterium]|jgi:sucrose-phosphate synthase|nr:glycosyltransferase [Rhodospirillaceae bacterium]MBT5244433.1 glycosyltransferase [Rhodospirillaceae bacterium]MBT5561376.1 glycosyltransferase [Rhodospirillaceae bacterium]MBT6242015.1 glycosyltransferase [Rhodospirillaceae bacterium]MBT7136717.1 glycosyltransferase [Rhodospirillaceae bacterium]
MHIAFLNPQGNFDTADSYLAEHPDFGGQLVYVKEVAQAMAAMGHKIDIVTRKIDDPEWPEFSSAIDAYQGFEENLRILRFPCGGAKFLGKEELWPHLEEFVRNMLDFYGDDLPDFATAHYGDGGYCAVLAKSLAGIGFTMTGHSLGAQKFDKLGTTLANVDAMEERYCFSRRIAAERLSMREAYRIITSTEQERREQYSHPLYAGAVDVDEPGKFSVIPPGVNTRIFTTDKSDIDATVKEKLDTKFNGVDGPVVLVSSRLDEKKNIIGVVQAYAQSEDLRGEFPLVLCVRGVDDPFTEMDHLAEEEQKVLKPILDLIEEIGIRDRVHFLNIQSQKELAATYRYFGERGSVFALTAFYEPFGLAPIEAAACGLTQVATKNGGPSEIFEGGTGILVDPFEPQNIAQGLLEGLKRHAELSPMAIRHVHDTYTWQRTAKSYLEAISDGFKGKHTLGAAVPELGDSARIADYLNTVETKSPS